MAVSVDGSASTVVGVASAVIGVGGVSTVVGTGSSVSSAIGITEAVADPAAANVAVSANRVIAICVAVAVSPDEIVASAPSVDVPGARVSGISRASAREILGASKSRNGRKVFAKNSAK